jgi:2-dehydro-3-deoxygalactonokinase
MVDTILGLFNRAILGSISEKMPGLIVNCDWGTTRFRLRAVKLDHFTVAAEFHSADGVASLARHDSGDDRPNRFRSVLSAGLRRLTARLGKQLEDAPVMISGMASSSIGWQEVAYARLPISLDGSQLPWLELKPIESDLGSHRVVLISGACSKSDVMRGEETELIGLFTLPVAAALAAESLVIKPGTHSKHVRVEDQKIVGLQTFMTGELFGVLGQHSILRHSLENSAAGGLHWKEAEAELRAGVRHVRSIPLSSALFRVRSRQLLDNLPGARNRAFFSGVLLGNELAYLTDGPLDDLSLVLCATEPSDAHYRAALDELGLTGRLTAIPSNEVELLSARGQALLWWKLSRSGAARKTRKDG